MLYDVNEKEDDEIVQVSSDSRGNNANEDLVDEMDRGIFGS